MSAIDDFLQNAKRYQSTFTKGNLLSPPARRAAIVACMDARLNVFGLLGLSEGDAHIIRNAGGVITPDTIRSLSISQRLLRTQEIMLIHHTDCGMLTITDDEYRGRLRADTGVEPDWDVGAFTDLDQDVRESIQRIRLSPFIPQVEVVRGFVYDVQTGGLREVQP
ncbi:MAG TPA: carbonic anhydrase [Streptosporangiaceae bacterium]|nr:carbonic anhydrase [Streptosporangiaceae bacterium]